MVLVRLDNNCVLWMGKCPMNQERKILPVRPAPFLDVLSKKTPLKKT
jgi:hypothetical protein